MATCSAVWTGWPSARAAASHSRLSAEELDSALWGGAFERDFETGKYDSRGYFERVGSFAGFDPDYDYEHFAEDFLKIILPSPDGEAGLTRAKELGARTFILSNTSFLHATKIFRNETLASVPELHILSYKVGVMKPDPGIWLKLLEYSGLEARDCFYIDDVEAYCQVARNLGFGAFRYDKSVHKLSHIVENVLQ